MYIGVILHRVCKIVPLYMGRILRRGTENLFCVYVYIYIGVILHRVRKITLMYGNTLVEIE